MNDTEFESLFREQFSMLCRLACSVVKDTDLAKDIVQQVFVTLWQKRTVIKVHTSAKSYLCKSVVNSAINHLSKEKRMVKLDEKITHPIANDETLPIEENGATLDDKVRLAINDLPPVCHKVFTLSRFSDLSNKEIASELHISVKAVEKHISKALRILRITLKPLLAIETILLMIISSTCIFPISEVGFYILTLS